MTELNILLATAVSIAFIHTIIGIDHYVPFIALAKANQWPVRKTMFTVFLCGIGHVLSSIVLGLAGIALAATVSFLVDIENIRGEISAYFIIAFGFVYTVYGIRHAVKNKTHRHITPDGNTIMHIHSGNSENHGHNMQDRKKYNVFWGLFILFVLGPCEPLIPILMYPAASRDIFTLVLVTVSFALCTIATMLLAVFLGLKSISLIKTNRLEKYSHALAGAAVFLCGICILVLPI